MNTIKEKESIKKIKVDIEKKANKGIVKIMLLSLFFMNASAINIDTDLNILTHSFRKVTGRFPNNNEFAMISDISYLLSGSIGVRLPISKFVDLSLTTGLDYHIPFLMYALYETTQSGVIQKFKLYDKAAQIATSYLFIPILIGFRANLEREVTYFISFKAGILISKRMNKFNFEILENYINYKILYEIGIEYLNFKISLIQNSTFASLTYDMNTIKYRSYTTGLNFGYSFKIDL